MKTTLTALLFFVLIVPEVMADPPRRTRDGGMRGGDRGSRGTARTERPRRERPSVDRTRRDRPTPTVDRNRHPSPSRADDGRAARDRRAEEANRRNRPVVVDRRHPAPDMRRGNPNRGQPRYRTANPYRPNRGYYGTRDYHRPPDYVYRPYSRYYHSPVRNTYVHSRRYRTSNDFFRFLRGASRTAIYLNWILSPSSSSNGYRVVNNYPYYIYNGYQHRYSTLDTCSYQLVDQYNHNIVRTYWNQSCYSGYNSCSIDRDNRNEMEWENRYFCAETFRDQNYDYSRPTYDYEYDDLDDDNGICYDYDRNTGICYDN